MSGMKEMAVFHIQMRGLIYLLICAGSVIIVVALMILPRQKQLAKIDTEIAQLNARIEEQKILIPLFRNLEEKAQTRYPEGFSFVKKEKLSREQIDRLPDIFSKMANESHLRLDRLEPEFDTLMENSKCWRMKLDVSGDFFDFRQFLFRLGELSWLDQIEQIWIQPQPESKRLSLGMTLCLLNEQAHEQAHE
ncbi:MAG: hypothetical protein PHY78_13195 [Desulfobacterales bacterium]|nr:hypothetical protein [Desulfobacterales bacterium]MDD4392849.1 hypothetical protein [Desulfobacterales bacterium]